MKNKLNGILKPNSIAVVGASNNKKKVAFICVIYPFVYVVCLIEAELEIIYCKFTVILYFTS